MIDNDNNIITGWSAITSDNKTTYTVPTLPGYLYGTSTVVDGVTMVIRLESENSSSDYAELRINLNVSRSQQTTITKKHQKTLLISSSSCKLPTSREPWLIHVFKILLQTRFPPPKLNK